MGLNLVNAQPAKTQRVDPQRSAQSVSSHGAGLSFASPIHKLQRAIGNRALSSLLRSRIIQPKLTVSQPADPYEREADRVADQVMRIPEPESRENPSNTIPSIHRVCHECEEELQHLPMRHEAASELSLHQSPLQIGRVCTTCEEKLHRQTGKNVTSDLDEDEGLLQMKGLNNSSPQVLGDIESYLSKSRGGGQPLPASTRDYFEPRFGRDFTGVRVHTDSAASDSARAVNAIAYTSGRDIVFGAGRYAPETVAGKRLLAHELVHTVQQGQAGLEHQVQRTCNPVPIAAKVGTRSGCTDRFDATFVTGPFFKFRKNCDEFLAGQDASLIAFAAGLAPAATLEIHGYASMAGGLVFNQNLGCARGVEAKNLLTTAAPAGAGIAPGRITGVINHGPVPGPAADRQSVVIVATTPPPPPPETVRSTKVSAVSFLSCAPCNPYTDDGARGVSPPATEPASGFRQKHSLIVVFTTPDAVHVNSATVSTLKFDVIGITGFCGRSSVAHIVSTRGAFGVTILPAGPHGEAVQLESELLSRLGATVPSTLPLAPCGFLGTSSLVPAIGNHFRIRLFADGTVESEFRSASLFPFHYLYENGTLKLFGGSPVSPAVDFAAWATSTGVPLLAGLAGFKALREACCTGGAYFGCPSTCVGGVSVPVAIPPTPCIIDATAKLIAPCPSSCAPAGSACGTLSRPSNP